MANTIFITGTDTGVGKTTVTCHLFCCLRDAGFRVGIVKPCETGCEVSNNGELLPGDALKFQSLLGKNVTLNEIVFYRFTTPVAPWVAASIEDQQILWPTLVERIASAACSFDVLICEGAGGLLVPIAPGKTFADLAVEAEMSTIVVAASKLGVLNHSLLTFEVLKSRGIKVLGYILNETQPRNDDLDASRVSNRDVLQTLAQNYDIQELDYLPFVDKQSGTLTLSNASAFEFAGQRIVDLLRARG